MFWSNNNNNNINNKAFYDHVLINFVGPMNATESRGDLVLINTFLLFSCRGKLVRVTEQLSLFNTNSEVSIN